MGLYNDIQKDLIEAASTDLADAVAVLTVDVEVLGAYNPGTGDYARTVTQNTMDCFVTETEISDDIDETANEGDATVIVLDSLKTVTFVIGLKVSVRDIKYQIQKIKTDGANASHKLTLRRLH